MISTEDISRPRLMSIDATHRSYCPGMSLRGWYNVLKDATVDGLPVLVRIGKKRLFVYVERLEKWLAQAPASSGGSR